jgi:hypothetical protein
LKFGSSALVGAVEVPAVRIALISACGMPVPPETLLSVAAPMVF